MRSLAVLALTLIAGLLTELQAADWTRFRGPGGQGHAESSVRTEWSASEGIRWRASLPGSGSSSPIVVGNRVFLTSYSENERHLTCLNADSGDRLWSKAVPAPSQEDAYQGFLTEHGFASATPVSDGQMVYAFYGKAGVVAYTTDGEQLWRADVGQMSSNRRWGSAASPVLFNDILIVNASEEDRAIVGLSTKDGSQVWRAEYDRLELCYATPALVEGEGGIMEAVISMPGEVWGINAATGKLRWFCEIDTGGNVSPSVVVGPDSFFTFGGYPQQQSNAIRRGGRKDITATHRVWQNRDSSYVATPLYHDGHLYWVSDRGQAFSVNARTGETVTRARLSGLQSGGRPVYASPVLAGEHVLVVTRRSGTFVFQASPKMKQVTLNPALDGSDFNATPAVVNGRLFLRSNEAAYCIE